jgi:cysteine protease ATG4
LFSLNNIIKISQTKYKIDAGEWLCPSMAVSILSQLMAQRDFSELDIRVFNEGIIYLDKLNTVLNEGWVRPNVDDAKSNDDMDETSLLIFVAHRLGMKTIDPLYYEAILNLFNAPCCIGFVGGKPDKAFYFVGANGDKLIYLDPHYVQVFC